MVDNLQGDKSGEITDLLKMLNVADSRSCPSQYLESMLQCICSSNFMVHCATLKTVNCAVSVSHSFLAFFTSATIYRSIETMPFQRCKETISRSQVRHLYVKLLREQNGCSSFDDLVDNSLKETLTEGDSVVCKYCHFEHRSTVITTCRLPSQ